MQQRQAAPAGIVTSPKNKFVLSSLKQQLYSIRNGMSRLAHVKSYQKLQSFNKTVALGCYQKKRMEKYEEDKDECVSRQSMLMVEVKKLRKEIEETKQNYQKDMQRYQSQILVLREENKRKSQRIDHLEQLVLGKVQNPQEFVNIEKTKGNIALPVQISSNISSKSQRKKMNKMQKIQRTNRTNPFDLLDVFQKNMQELNKKIIQIQLQNLEEKYRKIHQKTEICEKRQQIVKNYNISTKNEEVIPSKRNQQKYSDTIQFNKIHT